MRKFLLGGFCLFFLLLFCILCIHYLEFTEVGIGYKLTTGEVELISKAGWNFRPPWVLVAKIDTRPVRVCITSAGRGFNCKLVQFQSTAYKEFVAIEGFRFYWWANRISFNFGYKEEYRGMKDILRGHAFGVEKYSFFKILEDYPSPP